VTNQEIIKPWAIDELIEVARCQKRMIWAFCLMPLPGMILVILKESPIPYVYLIANLLIALIWVYLWYSLAVAIRAVSAWVYIILPFIPLLNLVALFQLSRSSTKVLSAHGIRVGLFGAKMSSFINNGKTRESHGTNSFKIAPLGKDSIYRQNETPPEPHNSPLPSLSRGSNIKSKIKREAALLFIYLILGVILMFIAEGFGITDRRAPNGRYLGSDQDKVLTIFIAPYLLLVSYRILRRSYSILHDRDEDAGQSKNFGETQPKYSPEGMPSSNSGYQKSYPSKKSNFPWKLITLGCLGLTMTIGVGAFVWKAKVVSESSPAPSTSSTKEEEWVDVDLLRESEEASTSSTKVEKWAEDFLSDIPNTPAVSEPKEEKQKDAGRGVVVGSPAPSTSSTNEDDGYNWVEVDSISIPVEGEEEKKKEAEKGVVVEAPPKPIAGVEKKAEIQNGYNIFISKLAELAPNYEKLNKNPKFIEWLNVTEPGETKSRLDFLRESEEARDAARAAKFFNEYEVVNKQVKDQNTYTYPNGNKYVGDMKNGIPHGKGILTSKDGDKYEGEFKNGTQSGIGTFTRPNGFKYVGEYRDGVANGIGTETYQSGGYYKGEFKNGKPNGKGTSDYSAGGLYEGYWKDGRENGHGILTLPDGTKYVGEWRDGKQHGQGIKTIPDGFKYSGEWSEGKPTGRGTLTFPNGTVYVGEFKNGLPNGHGAATASDGSKYEGEWRDGNPINNM